MGKKRNASPIRSGIAAVLCFICVYFLNTPAGNIPPLGKFLNPAAGFMANAASDEERNSKDIKLTNNDIAGTVYFDERLVPHIFAETDKEAYFLQGYIHARYRLWQMETQTRAASGRLSEIFGKDLLQFDREKRRLGMVKGAENALDVLRKDPETYNAILAYTDGINAFITKEITTYKSLPLEYKLLHYTPEQWTPLKTMLLLKYMANTLTGYDDDVEYTNVLQKIGRKDFDLLFPDRPTGIDPIIPSEKKYPFTQQDTITASASKNANTTVFEKLPTKKTENNGIGSNNWAVAPSKTKNGNAILCNDPHLQLNLPSLWFEVQLHTPTQNVYGVSLPGAPGVVIGFNDSISWGVTNGGIDVRDWYQITFKDAKEEAYLFEGEWKNIERKIERFQVKGEDDFIDTVLLTHHGPMVYHKFDTTKKSWNQLAMRWAAIDGSNDFKAFYLLNRAKNFEDYRSALSYFHCPTQNFVFASVQGDIAITQQGKHALKYPEQGRFVMDGSKRANDWNQFIPFEQNPWIKNPARGFVSSANQHPTDSTYPYYYTGCDFEFYRNRRINSLLSAMQNITTDDMKKIQQDNFNYIASEALPLMLQHLSEENRKHQIAVTLAGWDYIASAEAEAPSLFETWYTLLYDSLWDEFHDKRIAYIKPDAYNHVRALYQLPHDYFLYDLTSTKDKKETLYDIVNMTFTIAVQSIDSIKNATPQALQWYQYKHTSIRHIAQLPAFSRANIKTGGYKNIVNATSERNGPSWRMVVEMSRPVKAYGVYPGGQGGNPGSMYYENFIDDWAAGKYYTLQFYPDKTTAATQAAFSFTFK